MPRPSYPVTLISKKPLSANTIELTLAFDDKEQHFHYTAGQFVQLLFTADGQQHKRSYSIANTPENFNQYGHLNIAISFVENGIASSLFKTADTGLSMELTGPFGILTLPDAHERQLILGGTGTGIAPYHAMLSELEKRAAQGCNISVITGARHRNESIYHDAFQKTAEKYANFHYLTCLSREASIHTEQNEYTGYIQERFIDLSLDPDKDLVYLCGNPGMITDATSLLINQFGFVSKKIKREKYVYSGH
ncbi:Benzoate 1,2-dioxygenase electron transfer component [invertebrate metagenome]|uniref:Benzoate 1,2-dioxygenase electron transfer component n=1 Tax=invertebrate metagenome TaxID=1711999 RepID=A0A2H9TB76_9ZZZZ